ncbi:hypothetical protein OWV82_024125 [Melia azedarach]|uniref:Uncharacterized protein n=1 Tax=Melia azedarach TaxID=155640 RepID=A0ACC1WPD5_MELAZ|nr:hypothetical protein OWV82_024125 [Melia azedarach]
MSKESGKIVGEKTPREEEQAKAKAEGQTEQWVNTKKNASVIPPPKKLVKTMIFEYFVHSLSCLGSSSSEIYPPTQPKTKSAQKVNHVFPSAP